MASHCKNVELTQLSRVEKEAVDLFSGQLVERFGTKVSSISVHGLHGQMFQQTRELNLVVLLKKASPVLEAQVEDLALDQFIETGIYLQVRCFEQRQFKSLQKMKLPAVTALQQDAVSLWAA